MTLRFVAMRAYVCFAILSILHGLGCSTIYSFLSKIIQYPSYLHMSGVGCKEVDGITIV
jgi:hypothetical protein